jgi:opacity protein-like surface antigen
MKRFTLSMAALAAMGTLAMAGGDIEAPVEPVVEVEAPMAVSDSGFYIGGAYSAAKLDRDFNGWEEELDSGDGIYEEYRGSVEVEYDALMLQAGYKFNQYLAVEGRYWKSLSDGDWSYNASGTENDEPFSEHDSGSDGDFDFEAWGIYVKPMYPVTEELDVYALLGYGNVTLTNAWDEGDFLDENGFQWGLGASYALTDKLSVFADYVQLCDADNSESWEDEGYIGQENWDDTVYTVNIGLTYKF